MPPVPLSGSATGMFIKSCMFKSITTVPFFQWRICLNQSLTLIAIKTRYSAESSLKHFLHLPS